MPRVTFITSNGERSVIDATRGLSVMEIAREADLGIEGTCDGSLACATCHVIVDPEHAGRLKPASDEEEDMLDLAFGLKPTSRLGCQIVMSDDLDGLVVTIPQGL
ncbi:MAG: 2Fe-2S iron-sulfur cluster-binding protein [Geminicoccaceae bacterium]